MSQPPDPYQRQFSFTSWSLSHPTEPHQGDKIDLELDEVKESLDQTQSRLSEIQRDDGLIRAEALSSSLQAITDEAAAAAAEKTYADNLASVPDKAEARQNLQLSSFYSDLDGENVLSFGVEYPVFPVVDHVLNSPQPGQYSDQADNWLGPIGSFAARRFRAAVLTGSLYDYATWMGSGPMPEIWSRMDNLSASIGWAGTLGDGYAADPLGGTFPNPLAYNQQLHLLPSAQNPLASVRQIVDAISKHNADQPHVGAPEFVDIPAVGQFLRFTATNGQVYLVAATLESSP